MGSLKSIIGMLPGVGSKLKDATDDRRSSGHRGDDYLDDQGGACKALDHQPVPQAGVSLPARHEGGGVNRLLKQFDQMQKMMKQFGGKAGKGGKMNRRAMKRLANMNPEQLQSLQGGIPGVPPG